MEKLSKDENHKHEYQKGFNHIKDTSIIGDEEEKKLLSE